MAVLGPRFCERAFPSRGKRGPVFIAVHGPLTTAASPVAEHRLQTRRPSNRGSRAQSLRGMRDPPRPGPEPASPAPAGRLSTTAPPGKPENVLFLKQIVMSDEKWILYNNVEQKRLWGKRNEPLATTPKASLHPKKVMLCIWWDWKGVLYYDLLPETQTINSNKYCSQLDQLKAALDEKRLELVNRKRIIFHQDNARPRFFDDQAKTVRAWPRSSDSSGVFTRHCTFGFPFISVFTKFS